ncbi:hypothetical protein KCP69_04380 [Salmonella enterica subsp. enterica]|nr:hypothetical protein KCP69_04380 [Salmonella enterica subsp. enterica]
MNRGDKPVVLPLQCCASAISADGARAALDWCLTRSTRRRRGVADDGVLRRVIGTDQKLFRYVLMQACAPTAKMGVQRYGKLFRCGRVVATVLSKS